MQCKSRIFGDALLFPNGGGIPEGKEGVQYSPVRERNKIGGPHKTDAVRFMGFHSGFPPKGRSRFGGNCCLGAINENYHFIRRFYPVRIHTQINSDASDVFTLSRVVYAEARSVL